MQNENPMIKYGLSNNSTALDTSMGYNGIGTDSKKQKLYYNEYFHNDGDEDDEIQGGWEDKRAQMEVLLEQERIRYQTLESELEQNEKQQNQQMNKLLGQIKAKQGEINENN